MFPDLPSGRRLSDAERSQLAELERRLQEDDPTLAQAFGAGATAAAAPLEQLSRTALIAFAVVAVVLLVAATVVGGVGGAAAISASLAATAGVFAGRQLLRNGHGPRRVAPADRVAG
ncbi:MAG TPA: DUF3040 domain-containing protein [Pseudonocardia sp.]|nr:DUF3040 domain-containing protein [Pseudonocardia sp.]